MERKRVYTFGNGKAEGKADMRNLLGGKGANLAEMTNAGMPVPQGFTISTEAELRAFAAMVNGGRLCRQNGEAGKQHRHEQRALGACRNCGIYVRR